MKQPLLISNPKAKDKRGGNDKPIRLIPELCSLTGIILLKGFERDFAMKKDLDAVTKLNPRTRYDKLTQFLDKIKRTPESADDLARWQIDFSPEVVKASATIMVPMTVHFSNASHSSTERGWQNALRNGHHLSAIELRHWILFYQSRDENKARMFSEELSQTSLPMNFKVDRAQMIRLPDGRSGGNVYAQTIKNELRERLPQMIVCIVPNTAKDVYDAIKRVCCIEYGLPSQVVTANILNQQNMNKTKSVITKLAIQMNCKLGGEPWGVTIPVSEFL